MIGTLPTSLNVCGADYKIRSDYRDVLNIFQAFNDPELTEQEKCYVCMKCLYVDFEGIPQKHMQGAAEKAYWFCDGGNIPKESTNGAKTIDWEQDESIIFPAVNKVAGYETRAVPYMHWWAFLGLFNEIGEGLFSTVISIRSKQNKGKKLEKYEKDFLREHRNMVTLKTKKTAQELADEEHDRAFIEKLLSGE